MSVSVAASLAAIGYTQFIAAPRAEKLAKRASAEMEAGVAVKAGFRKEDKPKAQDVEPTASPTTSEASGSPTSPASPASPGSPKAKDKSRGPPKAAVDKAFLRHASHLFSIAFPTLRSRQGFHLAMLSILLLLRTYLSLRISALTGVLAKKMVQAKVKPFFLAIFTLAAWSCPAAFVNSGLKYFTAQLSVTFRDNLTKHFHKRYLCQEAFFSSVGLGGVDTVEQRITQDVLKWAEDASSLYQTLFKPIIDICLFSYQISQKGGWLAPGIILGYYAMVTVIMRTIAPNFAALTSQQQHKDARFREGHSKMLTYAEEVSFAHGERATVTLLNKLFNTSQLHAKLVQFRRAKHNIFEGLGVKYGAVMMGYAACALVIFNKKSDALSVDELTGLYIYVSRLLVDLAKAIGQFVLTYKTIASLAGYTHRVYELERSIAIVERNAKIRLQEHDADSPNANAGRVVVGDCIRFDKVPIVSPDRTVLVKALSFFVQPGMNVLVVGPNGCGKSSTFRLLGELWPIQGGRIEKPGYEHLYYVPQRPYLSSGTLREQVTYPFCGKEALEVSEAKLHQCLVDACLGDLVEGDGQKLGWDDKTSRGGQDVLSHGQKQKLAMARLFFHLPRFAILDECSSNIDLEVEQHLYSMCRKKGITLLTIAHRRSVWKYHNWVLRFDGNGGFAFSPVSFPPESESNDESIPASKRVQMTMTNIAYAHDESLVGKQVVVTEDGRATTA